MDVTDLNEEDNTVGGMISELTPMDKLALVDSIDPTQARADIISEILNTEYFKSDAMCDPTNQDYNRTWLDNLDDEELIKKHLEYC